MSSPKKRPGLLSGVLNFLGLLAVILILRWALFEIFVIPSGSMYPKLYVNDYIWVSKFDYGVRLPFSQKWLYGPTSLERSSIVVFRSPDDTKFYVKRLVGLPGDQLKIHEDFIVSVNGQKAKHIKVSEKEKLELSRQMNKGLETFDAYYEEVLGDRRLVLVPYMATAPSETKDLSIDVESFTVPQDHILFMGDNRHQSYDGRRFGYLPAYKVVGRARRIILSCSQKVLLNAGCDLRTMRFNRLGNPLAH